MSGNILSSAVEEFSGGGDVGAFINQSI